MKRTHRLVELLQKMLDSRGALNAFLANEIESIDLRPTISEELDKYITYLYDEIKKELFKEIEEQKSD